MSLRLDMAASRRRPRKVGSVVAVLAVVLASPVAAQPIDAPVDPYGEPVAAPKPPGKKPPATEAPSDRPVDPYGAPAAAPKPRRQAPAPAAGPTPEVIPPPAPSIAAVDIDLAEKIAAALHERGIELFGSGDYAGAKILFIESLERSPSGSISTEALQMLHSSNQKLGIADVEDGRPGAGSPTRPDGGPLDPYGEAREDVVDPYGQGPAGRNAGAVVQPVDASPARGGRGALYAFGGTYGFLAGLALAGPEDDQGAVGGAAVVVGAIGAAAGVAAAWWADRQWTMTAGQRAAIVAGGALGALGIGMLTDSVTGDRSNGFETDANDLYRGAALGGLLGTGGGILWARGLEPSAGDVALAQSLALYGAGTGMLLGVALDPPHNEAYTLNGTLGTAAGLAAGIYLSGRAETTRGRMLWVDLGAAAGAAAPWLLLYPLTKDDGGRGDEQVAGFVSSVGLLAGAATAWFVTRNLDASAEAALAHAALLERSPDGSVRLGLTPPRAMVGPQGSPGVGIGLVGLSF